MVNEVSQVKLTMHIDLLSDFEGIIGVFGHVHAAAWCQLRWIGRTRRSNFDVGVYATPTIPPRRERERTMLTMLVGEHGIATTIGTRSIRERILMAPRL